MRLCRTCCALFDVTKLFGMYHPEIYPLSVVISFTMMNFSQEAVYDFYNDYKPITYIVLYLKKEKQHSSLLLTIWSNWHHNK